MKRVIRGIISVFMFILLSGLSLGIHASAVQPMNMGHSMGTSHQTNLSSCFTTCTTATLLKEDVVKDTNKDEDDAPQPPLYVQFKTSPLAVLKEIHNQEAKSA